MSAQAKPHIHRHDGYWWVLPWRGAQYGICAKSMPEAWKRWGGYAWMFREGK